METYHFQEIGRICVWSLRGLWPSASDVRRPTICQLAYYMFPPRAAIVYSESLVAMANFSAKLES